MTTNSTAIGTMELGVLSYELLKAHDRNEIEKLIRVLSEDGLFFLNLSGPSAKDALADIPPLVRHQRQFFEQEPSTKSEYHNGLRYKGYYGTDFGVEKLHFGREEHLQGTLNIPSAFQPVASKLASTSAFMDSVLREIGILLTTSMNPPVPQALDHPEKPGLSNLTVAISKAKAGTILEPTHSDPGVLTMTFYDEPFLEVLDRKTRGWRVVEVKDNMPIINVGQELEKNSDDRLYAPVHQARHRENEIDLVMFDLFESPRTVPV
ncbi:hypothetical protein QBC35DRAFT_494950, partial [Podospora australis]